MRSVKIDKLLKGLDRDLASLSGLLDWKKIKVDSDLFQSVLAKTAFDAMEAFHNAELTKKDQAELEDLESDLAKLDAKHDKIASKYYLEIAPEYGKIASDHAKDPVALVVAMTDLEARKADKIGTLDLQRETDSEITNECIRAIQEKKSIAGMDAAKIALKWTEKTQKTTSHKIGEAEFLVLDLLKKRSAHGQFHVGKDRVVGFMPVHKDWGGKKNGKEKIKIGEWYEVGTLAITDDLTYQTALQRWCYDWVNRFSGSFEKNTDRVNAVFVQGSAKSIGVNGQTGGTANTWRVVSEITEGQGRQVTREDLQDPEQYNLTIVYETDETEK